MIEEYVTFTEGAYRIAGSRVSLDSIIYGFWQGESPETIAQSFPTLRLEQVYGAIAFYLAHQAMIDEYMRQGEAEFDVMRRKAQEADPMFYQKMADARRKRQSDAA